MKGIVPEGAELMPHRCSQSAPSTGENNRPVASRCTPTSRPEPAVPLAKQSTRTSRPAPEVPFAAQSTPIKKLCRNRGLVLQDETVTPGTQKLQKRREEEAPAGAHEATEEKMAATVAPEVMKDKMVKDRNEILLTYKRRRLFQDD